MTSFTGDNPWFKKAIIGSLLGILVFWGIRLVVVGLWPEQSSLPPAVVYIPLQGLTAVVAACIGTARAWRMKRYGIGVSLIVLALIIIGLTVFALWSSV